MRLLDRLRAAAVAATTLLAVPAQADPFGPEVQRWDGREGAAIYFIEARELPMVDVRVILDAGSARDRGTPGLAGLTARTLDQGAGDLDAGELARRLEDVGARLNTSAGRHQAEVHLRSLSESAALDASTELLEQVLGAPSFDDAAVERERRRMQQALRAERQSASRIALRSLYAAMYGDHPYATPPSGTEAGLESLDAARVAAFHAEHYVAANASVAIVGDLDREEAEALAARLLGAMEAGEPAPSLPAPPSEPKETEVRIDFPASQTALMMGLPAIARGEEELEYPLRVANHVLGGGGLVSRLYQSMREERGLSYASSSSLNIMPLRGPWLIRSTVEAGRGEEALEVLRGEIERLARDGLDSEEIDAAVRHLTGAFPLSVANNSALAGQLSVLAANRLPADHLARYIPRMEAVDEQAIRRALDERLDLARMVTVLVGPDVEDADVEMDPP